ncbi:MAG: hypothetical protein QF437_07140 [Planctomycetota bacterium]|jgi:hypothetical protein|nr:hypothetical protein [Planctomycetota bacterium]MDP7130245.1 hypothetical protein [Planctomycetota bacterium]MDP7253470.1 hypothetical protein [Planctomycetota bacterium]
MAVAALNNIPTFNNFAAILAQGSGDPAISSDVFRQATQSQDISQSSSSFAGAQTTNSFTAEADLTQNATADNTKDITVNAASGTGLGANSDFVQPRHTGIILGGPLRGSAVSTFLQDQGGSQDSFANQTDAQGNPSQAGNTLDLTEQLNSTLSSASNTTVNAPTTFTGDQPQVMFVVQGSDTNPRVESLVVEEEEEPTNVFGSLTLPPLTTSSALIGNSSPALDLPVFTPSPATANGAFSLSPLHGIPSFIPQIGGATVLPYPAFTPNLLNVFA